MQGYPINFQFPGGPKNTIINGICSIYPTGDRLVIHSELLSDWETFVGKK